MSEPRTDLNMLEMATIDVNLSNMEVDAIRAAIAELIDARAELAKLRAVVGKLPKTADGVPVAPGDTVWYLRYIREPERCVIAGYSSSDSVCCPDNPGSVYFKPSGFSAIWNWNNAYSTRELAEAAMKAGGK